MKKTNNLVKLERELERKLRLERFERCGNCKLLDQCTETKDQVVLCERFKELPLNDQVIVVNLMEYSKLKGTKNMSLCSF